MSFTNIVQTIGNVQGIVGAATNFVQSITSMFGGDIVGVFDNTDYSQLFASARPVKLNVTETRKVMQHPIESGSLIQDFAITMPVEIELSMLLPGDDGIEAYKQIRTYFLTGQLVTILTRTGSYQNMLIESMPHEESADMFDAVPLAIKLREVQTVLVQYQQLTTSQVQSPSDSSTVDTGTQQPQSSALYSITNFVKGII
jgi:hypothetical protein